MSGYLEVKYPFKSNIGLNPFKSWKRQWCILRPGLGVGGGSLAVYCSEAGASAGIVELRSGSIVKRAKSRSRPHAFAVFSVEEPCKPRILLAAQTLQEAQQWMDKIRELLNGQKLLGTETLLKDSYSVTIIPTELSQQCGVVGDSTLTLSSSGLLLARARPDALLLRWQNITDVLQERENGDKNKTCILSVDSGFNGGGEMKLTTALNSDLANAVKLALKERRGARRSRSHPELNTSCDLTGELRRSSWYSGPSEVSLDDTDFKEAQRIPSGQLSRYSGRLLRTSLTSLDDSMCDRRSLASVASGVYEEISEEPRPRVLEEPTYESVADCIYATMRRSGKRHPPPPLPPRQPYHTMKLGESWSSRMEGGAVDTGVTRHSSLGSLHHKPTRPAKPFSVFRKRLKSDSRIATSPKSDPSKENKDVETKKKKFDFTPTRDIFKSFKVRSKIKSLKLNSGLSKGETKSCEFLDETQHVTSNRCSKSVECLEGNDGYDEFDGNLSLEVTEEPSVDFVPQELFQLILCPDLSKVRLKDPPCLRAPCLCEGDYMPMSPIVPPPIEHHYMVMSPRTNQA
ncbi:uncharacterized protein [Maniola hyperantus]|uniref:uncharacterized protein isoform X2 n=1 Tax=Aphantopus hyperantus TaxID=2795564 RepID=UPI00374950F6